jgi:hypothetical protein
VAAFHKCTDLRGWSEEGAWAMYRAAQSLDALNRTDDAIEALAKGMTRNPGIPELPWYAAYLSWSAGKKQHAAWWAKLAVVHGCYEGTCPPRTGFEYPFARYEGPYDMLQYALRSLGDKKGAAKAAASLEKAAAKRQGTADADGDASKNAESSADATALPSTGASSSTPATRAQPPSASSAHSAKPRIGLGFTTAKRPEYFRRTYLSFRCDDRLHNGMG